MRLGPVCRLLLVVLLMAPVASAEAPATQPVRRTVRLLTVGNSFAHDSTRYLRQIAAAAGDTVVLGQANRNGCSLRMHWQAVAASEADPNDPAGRLYVGPGGKRDATLRERLTADRWDYVTLQQASGESDRYATYLPYAVQLRDYVKRHAPQAEVLIHQTWAYREDHAKFTDGSSTPQQMHEAVRANYHALAKELAHRLIPVGDAVHAARSVRRWAFVRDEQFDPATAVYPTLPNEPRTVHAGWKWGTNQAGERVLVGDAFHLSVVGQYLGACVFYEFLFDKSVVGNSFLPAGLSAEEAALLQAIAHDMLERQRTAALQLRVSVPARVGK